MDLADLLQACSTVHYPPPTTHHPLPTTNYPPPITHYPLPEEGVDEGVVRSQVPQPPGTWRGGGGGGGLGTGHSNQFHCARMLHWLGSSGSLLALCTYTMGLCSTPSTLIILTTVRNGGPTPRTGGGGGGQTPSTYMNNILQHTERASRRARLACRMLQHMLSYVVHICRSKSVSQYEQ